MKIQIAGLHELLTDNTFTRRNHTWNRTVNNGFVDVINLQLEFEDQIFINVGVCDPLTYELCWAKSPRSSHGFVDEARCIVRTRTGDPILGGPYFLPSDDIRDPDSVREAMRIVEDAVLPFLGRLHSPAALEKQLESTGAAKSRYPLPAIYLAILRHRNGNYDAAKSLLTELHGRLSGPWKRRVAEVDARLPEATT